MTKEQSKDPMVRFSVAVGGELLEKFDAYCLDHRYPTRSEAVRGLMRSALIAEAVANDEEPAMGVVTLIYDHHAGQIGDRLTELQHDHLESVVTTTHVHLDHRRCLEVILLKGRVHEIRLLADSLIGTKGVEMGKLVLAAAKPPETGADTSETEADSSHPHTHSHPHPHHHDHKHH